MKTPRASRFKVGARIGADLTVLGRVDDTGSEPVYIVWHHRAWCPMACKVFRHPGALKREARILAVLSHPNTVRFLGLGDPQCLLMEFLEGPTLSKAIRDRAPGRFGVSDALRVAIHLGAALEHLHGKGFLHLDVKPGNVIVVHGRPVLFDFGSARRQDGRRPAHVAGTDPYIAPEECLREAVGPPADVFGLGVTLYRLLTGRLPFREGTRRKPFPQIEEAPASVRAHSPTVPKRLDELVLGCLAREAASRPAIAALLPALHGFIRGGRPMWPAGFRPDGAAPLARVRAPAQPRIAPDPARSVSRSAGMPRGELNAD